MKFTARSVKSVVKRCWSPGSMRGSTIDVPWIITFFELEGDTVWGATAAMLRQLLVLSLGVADRRNYRVDP